SPLSAILIKHRAGLILSWRVAGRRFDSPVGAIFQAKISASFSLLQEYIAGKITPPGKAIANDAKHQIKQVKLVDIFTDRVGRKQYEYADRELQEILVDQSEQKRTRKKR
ncbi:35945_t:CDS:2, partial [Racocetra persica]